MAGARRKSSALRGRTAPARNAAAGCRADHGRRTAGHGIASQGAGAAASLIDRASRRFPWPANPDQRYSVESPYLAVINARGPWAVWRHGAANPPFIPLCLDLLGKGFWRRATNDQRMFAVTLWLRAAQEDDWGIIWGDPVRMCSQWGLESGTFTDRLEWMIGEGLACYLTEEEAEAARSWRPASRRDIPASRRGSRGREKGGSKRGEKEQGQAESRQDKTRQDKKSACTAGSQISSPSARSFQVLGGVGGKDQEQAKQHKTRQAEQSKQGQAKSQHSKQVTAEGTEPANLPKSDRRQGRAISRAPIGRACPNEPKSDHGAGNGPPRPHGGVRGLERKTRPRPVSRPTSHRPRATDHDVTTLGEALAWCNPTAVEFGRGMFEAITGHAPPVDLMAADDGIKADVGVWVHYWLREIEPVLPCEKWSEFRERCYRDVAKKRKVRSIRNLGRVAMARIVPGILVSMNQ